MGSDAADAGEAGEEGEGERDAKLKAKSGKRGPGGVPAAFTGRHSSSGGKGAVPPQPGLESDAAGVKAFAEAICRLGFQLNAKVLGWGRGAFRAQRCLRVIHAVLFCACVRRVRSHTRV